VGEAAGAEDTLLLAERLRPDLIVLDVDMPGTTGVEALPALRRVAPDATIVLLTVGDPAAAVAAGGAAADGLLMKSRDLGGFVSELAALVTSPSA
jgi:two-component system NarL family response regulator